METREELISGLQRTLGLMNNALSLQRKRAEIRAQYQGILPVKEPWSTGRRVLTFLGLCLFPGWLIYSFLITLRLMFDMESSQQMEMSFSWKPGLLITGILVFLLLRRRENKKVTKVNEQIRAQNEQAQAHNQPILMQEQAVIEKIKQAQERLAQELPVWYPRDYCCIDAAEFFLNAIQNHRADSIKEAVNLYETTQHQQRLEAAQQQMLENQQESIRQQRFANMLSAANLVMQAGTQAAVDQNTQAVHQQTRAVNDMKNAKWTIRFK